MEGYLTYQSFQILSVLSAETAVGFPHPVPPGSVSTSRSEEYDSVVGLHWGRRCRFQSAIPIVQYHQTHTVQVKISQNPAAQCMSLGPLVISRYGRTLVKGHTTPL